MLPALFAIALVPWHDSMLLCLAFTASLQHRDGIADTCFGSHFAMRILLAQLLIILCAHAGRTSVSYRSFAPFALRDHRIGAVHR